MSSSSDSESGWAGGSASAGQADAVIVGSGPNGLAAAVLLARAGLTVAVHEAADEPGGGARTTEAHLPGFHVDTCSAVHPMAAASPFFRTFDLAAHGVELLQPPVAYAHPMDGGRAGLAWRDLDRTADGLGPDGRAWRRLFGPLAEHWQGLADAALSDLRHPPHDPATALRLGRRILTHSSPAWLRGRARFRDHVAPAMLAGVAAHAIRPPGSAPAAAVGLVLATLAHAVGWPLPRGGSGAITHALIKQIHEHGGRIITGHRVTSLAELPRAKAILLDVTPAELVRITGDELPARYVRALRRFRHGGGATKVDFALSGPVPWTAPGCDLAGTLHLIGTRGEAQAAERDILAGRHPDRPYVLAVQPGVVDPTRAPTGADTLSAYAHVPHDSSVDVTPMVIAQVERFAPGFRDLILAHHTTTAAEQERHNPNYIGGDIAAGAMTLRQTLLRPALRWDPYATPLPGVYLCSASTPPGPGVHGMAGTHAARRALRQRFGIRTPPPTA
ncbi:phytoene desaturase family protein [Streptomyces ureilyticus]|uniref:Pyridine nucleotide-disulfide oxidoreductase domain-containing protein 2 n=1 Tax=Streptomyces ureilyticus TaxID=1775131 RepID=A0ABX0DMY2_9ACTN|nr:NAD(P)/FAD-dependent oxidoreductase [Streptomyces ureilyticus]NGO43241.1 NAD(P)/FAD-dependent oxidoreductase [Streptomyces ureilyticus]